MAILKSEIVGKSIGTLKAIITGGKHPIWSSFTVDAVDFLSRCTLRYVNSFGGAYKIDPTSELTIIHTDGTRYPVDSYNKLLNMIITDYTEPTGATMPPNIRNYRVRIKNTTKALREKLHKALLVYGEPVDPNTSLILPTTMVYENFRFNTSDDVWYCTDTVETTTAILIEDFLQLIKSQEQPIPTQPQPGTHLERLNHLANNSPKGEIVTVEEVTSNYIHFSGNRYLSTEEFLKRFKPGPDLDTPSSEPTSTKQTKFKTTKPKPVAQPEPNIPTPIKETFMSKIKDSASATVDQNKQALVIASKMEAGRIINKQVLKQLTPHLPFFFQGYAKSPFAPFVAANLVAMVANHTGNSKLTKVSDLMLLGAADSGIATFNLDKIVDDILSNIKLPAGVLDQDIE